MGRGRDTLWIDPVSRPQFSTFWCLGVVSAAKYSESNGSPANNLYTGCSSSANSCVTAISCSAHFRQGLIVAKIGKRYNQTLFLLSYLYRAISDTQLLS